MSDKVEGDEGVSKSLNIVNKGANLFKEINSGSESEEAELEELLQQEEEIEAEAKELEKPATSNQANATNTNATRIDQVQQEIKQLFQKKLNAFDMQTRRTRIVLVRKIAGWAFEISKDQEGKIDRAAFYSGVLLVHLHLAKYVGVAACQPPSREQVDELFYLADADTSNLLDKKEFTNAVMVATAPLTKRIGIYWSLLAILPILVARTMGSATNMLQGQLQSMNPSLFVKGLAILEFVIQLILSRIFFSILVPNIFSRIDRAARDAAYKRSRRRNTTSLWWLRMSQSDKDDWSTWFQQMMQTIKEGQKGSWFWSSTASAQQTKEGVETADTELSTSHQSSTMQEESDTLQEGKRSWKRFFRLRSAKG